MAAASSHSSTSEVIAYEENRQPVKLVYDTWTPRPHFIVVQTKPSADATSDELEATYKIIGSFLRANPKFDEDAILSFHRGKWYQQHTGKWHAHLCVPKQPYLEEAKVKITISNNKEWKGARTVEEGINAWHARKVQEYAKYKNGCVKEATLDETLVENVRLSMFDSNEFQLVWTSPAPRIGIVALPPAAPTLVTLYTFMSKVRSDIERELTRRDRSFSNFGCHLCLYVCGQSGTTVTRRQDQIFAEDGKLNMNSNIVGYIQMDESQYVQWLPKNLRAEWLTAFRSADHFVRT